MPTYSFVIAIVAIVGGLAYAAYEQHVKLQLKQRNSSKDDEAMKNEIAQLKERIVVLEKIVTDEKYNLRKEIDSLDKAS